MRNPGFPVFLASCSSICRKFKARSFHSNSSPRASKTTASLIREHARWPWRGVHLWTQARKPGRKKVGHVIARRCPSQRPCSVAELRPGRGGREGGRGVDSETFSHCKRLIWKEFEKQCCSKHIVVSTRLLAAYSDACALLFLGGYQHRVCAIRMVGTLSFCYYTHSL